MDTIIGGLDVIETDRMKSGGKEIVIGGMADQSFRRRAIRMKYVPRTNHKMILAVLDLSRPLTFGRIEFDDGSSKSLVRRRVDPNAAMIKMLDDRLNMSADKLILRITSDFELRRPLLLALSELINTLLKYIRRSRPNMRAIKVDGDMGFILDQISLGDKYFKVATDQNDWPATMPAIVIHLIGMLKSTKMSKWVPPKLNDPKWPSGALPKLPSKKPSHITTYQLMRAIVLRENKLAARINAIEEYYIDAAQDVMAYRASISTFLNQA
jgi:hypothetical protein